jgi:hypothetical protein
MPQSDRGPHEADLARWNAATATLKRRHEELVADAGQRVGVPGYAYLYARAILAADDHDGRRLGWVTRADLVRWEDLLIVARAAVARLDDAHTGQDLPGCAACDLHRAIGRLRTTSVRRTAPPS